LSDAALTELEDEAILAALRRQQATGQQMYVDGEFRRTGFMTGFPESVEGFVQDTYAPIAWKGGSGNEGPSPNTQLVIGIARWVVDHNVGTCGWRPGLAPRCSGFLLNNHAFEPRLIERSLRCRETEFLGQRQSGRNGGEGSNQDERTHVMAAHCDITAWQREAKKSRSGRPQTRTLEFPQSG
jgi:hypothetical protein